VSRKEFDDAMSARQLGEASVQQAIAAVRQAEINLSYTDITAPVAGITGRSVRSVGALITPDATGSLLTTIDQLTPIWVRFSLAESDLAKVPGGRIARGTPIDVSLIVVDGTPYPLKGRLNFAASSIDAKLGTQQLRAEFDNPKEQLLPGQFVKVALGAGQRNDVFLVPQAAVVQTEKAYLVFVVDAEGKVQTRAVQVGDWAGSDWTILSGLNTGDRVIVDNLQKIRPGAAVTVAQDTPVASSASPPK
jgi:membrane fusion protein (multidrug efflux system)